MEETNNLERISFQKIGRSILAVLNLERGIFYTIIALFTKSGAAIEIYLKKDRKKLLEPTRFLLVILALTTLVFLKFDGNDFFGGMLNGMLDADNDSTQSSFDKEKLTFYVNGIKEYCNVFLVFILPLTAFFSWDMFDKSNYNGAEHLVINMYIFSIQSLIYILFTFLLIPFSFEPILIVFVLSTIYQLFVYYTIFKEGFLKSIYKGIVVILGSFIVYLLLLFILLALIIISST